MRVVSGLAGQVSASIPGTLESELTVARFELDRRGIGHYLKSVPLGAAVERVAEDEARALVARTPRETGETAGSTRVGAAMFPDRRGAWISQAGASVAQHWGNARTRARHYATRRR